MNAAHIHLVVNHLPLFAVLIGGGLLAFGMVANQTALTRAAFVLGVVAAIGAVVSVQSGERAEDIVEEYAGVSEDAIHDHEEAAEGAQWAVVALGLVSLLGLVAPKSSARVRSAAEWAALALSVVSIALLARAANLGGLIRHPEIRTSAVEASMDAEDEDKIEHQ